MPVRDGAPGAGLIERRSECDRLVQLIDAVRGGRSRTLVLRGAPGVGKTSLLDHLIAEASDCRVLRLAGVQSEMELVFAGLHQLCAPLLDRMDRLPAPQAAALRVALGLSEGAPPDRFLVGMGVLSLLSEVASDRPLICVVDDHHWLDRASAQALGFVARRLAAEPVGLVFATRTPSEELRSLPELSVSGLSDSGARTLLDSLLTEPIDERVREQLVTETAGNPLALMELSRGLKRADLAGGFGLPGAVPLWSRIEDSFLRQFDALPADTRLLLLIAAADPSGDAALVHRAAERLGVPAHAAAAPAVESQLARFTTRVSFRHPLLRSAVYRSSSAQERQRVHRALADATDQQADPDRRAWHRSQAASGPDEAAAADLERCASRARARGGPAAAAAFLERSVLLTADPARRTDRTLAAAQANLQAGAYDRALDLLHAAETEPLDDAQSARADLLRARVAFSSGLGSEAPPLLLKAAGRLRPLDLDLARETYLNAWFAAMFAGGLATGGSLRDVSEAARELPASECPDPAERVLDALSLVIAEGPEAAKEALRRATGIFTDTDLSDEEVLRWGWFAYAAAVGRWDHHAWRSILQQVSVVMRRAGAFDLLPIVLATLATVTLWAGDVADASVLMAESDAVCEATGAPAQSFAPLLLAALRGESDRAVPMIEAAVASAPATGQGVAVTYAHWAAAILHNGHSRYEEALEAATRSAESSPDSVVALWALPELVEAAVRTGRPDLAAGHMDTLAASTTAGGTDVGLGIEARSRALLHDGQAAEQLYVEAIERLSRTGFRPDLGRAHLLYGEWLRREGRRSDARTHLRTAEGQLSAVGADAFAARARWELLATGEHVRTRGPRTTTSLTAQEALIARLAREGHTNAEIGTQLFLSARTVEWHLRKVFGKLGIRSRRELTHLAQLTPEA
ncbi:ATP-binding protein [Streptomyces sp. NPDC001292]|uniref:ATP-binding protein n=1 Tax=Streptomyces sp. NPDC001292 TaxID=3364558 RepID=UPI0036BB0A14